MSTAYYKIAQPVQKIDPRGGLGFGAKALALIAAGAVGGYLLWGVELPRTALAPPEAATIERIALPEMDPSLGYWDHVDSRPAVSATDTSMGFWDTIDTRPAVSINETSMGYSDHVDNRPAVSALEVSRATAWPVEVQDYMADLPAVTTGRSALAQPDTLAVVPFDEIRDLPLSRGEMLVDAVPFDEHRDAAGASTVVVALPTSGFVEANTQLGIEAEAPRYVVREGFQGYEAIYAEQETLVLRDQPFDPNS
jgi:hypothetical protein